MMLNAHSEQTGASRPHVKTITLDAPWRWLSQAAQDIKRAPMISLPYGLAFALISVLLALSLLRFEASAMVVILGPGFLLVAPLFAIGLYEASRQLEKGKMPYSLFRLFRNIAAPSQVLFMGVVLMIAFLAWIRIATLLFALFVHGQYGMLSDFIRFILEDPNGLALVIIGTLIGGAIAFVIFALSAISLPLLLARDIDAVTAMLTSLEAVRKNPGPMILWAWIIAILTLLGIVTFFAGMVFMFPLVGHATWHAYRDLVEG